MLLLLDSKNFQIFCFVNLFLLCFLIMRQKIQVNRIFMTSIVIMYLQSQSFSKRFIRNVNPGILFVNKG